MRYRDTNGALQQRGYCTIPHQRGLDGRWLQQVGFKLGLGQSVATIYPNTVRAGSGSCAATGRTRTPDGACALGLDRARRTRPTACSSRSRRSPTASASSTRCVDRVQRRRDHARRPPRPAAARPGCSWRSARIPRGAGPARELIGRGSAARGSTFDVSGRRVATLFDGDARGRDARDVDRARAGERRSARRCRALRARLTTAGTACARRRSSAC